MPSSYGMLLENYGRVDIQMIPENDWFRVTTYFNPKPGSRKVEYDPAKQVKFGQ